MTRGKDTISLFDIELVVQPMFDLLFFLGYVKKREGDSVTFHNGSTLIAEFSLEEEYYKDDFGVHYEKVPTTGAVLEAVVDEHYAFFYAKLLSNAIELEVISARGSQTQRDESKDNFIGDKLLKTITFDCENRIRRALVYRTRH